MADDSMKALADELKAVRRALDDMAKGAKDAQDDTKKLGETAERAGAGARALAAVTGTLKSSLVELKDEALHEATAALEEFARNLPESAARSERHEQALRQLGAAYGAVQHATNGAVSAEQAAAVQQRALQGGLRLSAQELAAVTSRAREFARSTGTDLNQALEQLTDQLVDPGEELRKFGVFLRTGMNAGDALRETLRQLGAQAGQTRTAQLSLAESMEAATRAQQEASDALAGMIAQRLELADFFTQFTSWVNDARGATDGWKTATDAVLGTLREAVGLRSQIGGAANQSASGAFTGQAGALMQQARARGLNFRGFEIGRLGVDATPEQRNRVLTLLRRAAMGNLGASFDGRGVDAQAALDAELGGFSAEVGQTRADRERQQREAAAAAARARAEELARRNRASQSAGGGGTRAPREAEGFGIGTAGFLTDLARNTFERLRREFNSARSPAEGGGVFVRPQTVEDRFGALQRRRQSADARMALDASDDPQQRFMGGMFSRDAGRAETQQRQERIRVIREQQTALRELLAASQAEVDTAMRHGRPISDVNELLRQRIGIQTALAQSNRDLVAAQEEQMSGFAVVGEKLLGVLDGVAEGVGESVVAAFEGSKSFGEAMEEMARATLRAVAKMAIVEALKNAAMAVAAAATYRYDAAAQHGIAAGLWTAVGGAAVGGVAAMGTGQKPAASAGGGAPAARAEGGGRAARADDRATGGGPLTLVLNVSGAAFTDAGVQQAAAVAIREAAGNGFLRREHLAPLLGD